LKGGFGLRCKIHRGCHEVGGNCVEVESGGKRIILDLGLPLKNNQANLPKIEGLKNKCDDLLGIFISHAHPDHYGMLTQIEGSTSIFIGDAARRIIDAASVFTRLPGFPNIASNGLIDREPIQLGPFTITPYLIDHSAHDAYCLLIEADGKRLFYSGDIRGHGRLSHLFDQLVSNPPQDIGTLICEGTLIGRTPDFAFPNEMSVEDRMTEIFEQSKGMSLVWCSSQNLDRVNSLHQAARRSNRKLILDMYSAEILASTMDLDLPQVSRRDFRVFLPKSQRYSIIKSKRFDISDSYKRHRIYPNQLKSVAAKSVMIFRPSMFNELLEADCLNDANLITSTWAGYLENETERLEEMEAVGIDRYHSHTSGHATVAEIKRFISAFPSSKIIPIHLEDREGFSELSANVVLKNDGEWWEV
jgi:ribonuclease J